ncbi:hypothetical protein M758_2G130700 [Ceratodon purpureus]|nr:hypothetical protein M758_UG190400 [Ceratodon purpureus]KAG0595712.1 hypothetical protein M758_UG191000 [Ceratodon purpureus]KAG0626491.1 hypothetical protein M758_2G130700 [Ceratodon purpureus]
MQECCIESRATWRYEPEDGGGGELHQANPNPQPALHDAQVATQATPAAPTWRSHVENVQFVPTVISPTLNSKCKMAPKSQK